MNLHVRPEDALNPQTRAADPARYQSAVTKLTQASPGTFADALGTAAGSRTGVPIAPQPSADTVLTRFRTAATATCAPSPASVTAVCSPIPLLAPVTRATVPSRGFAIRASCPTGIIEDVPHPGQY